MSQKWFLYYNDSQHGPFSLEKIQEDLHQGKLTSDVYVWKKGMEDWVTLLECEDFDVNQKIVSIEKRSHPRKPLVAKVISTDQKEVSFGICSDVSLGGMQVLTDSIPGEEGSQIQLNVSQSQAQGKLPDFIARGTIVRILENQQGYSFRFDDLSDDVKEFLKSYVRSAH